MMLKHENHEKERQNKEANISHWKAWANPTMSLLQKNDTIHKHVSLLQSREFVMGD